MTDEINQCHVKTISEMLDYEKCPVCNELFDVGQLRYLVEHRDTWTFRHFLVICTQCEQNKPIDYYIVATLNQ